MPQYTEGNLKTYWTFPVRVLTFLQSSFDFRSNKLLCVSAMELNHFLAGENVSDYVKSVIQWQCHCHLTHTKDHKLLVEAVCSREILH